MTTNNNNDGLPWKAEEEHLIWISFVIVSPSREDAYKKVLKWYKANGENGSYPEDCIESGIDMVEREKFPKTKILERTVRPEVVLGDDCNVCDGRGYSDKNFPLARCVQCGGSGVI
jgi:hypothetical protein